MTAHLQLGSAPAAATPPAQVAWREGLDELRDAGFTIEQERIAGSLTGLPPEADLVASRIVAEALHNILKHGEPAAEVVASAQRSPRALRMELTNGPRHRPRTERSTMGIDGMHGHARLLGGSVRAELRGTRWVCTVDLPLNGRAGERE